jgi:hypothetical protein
MVNRTTILQLGLKMIALAVMLIGLPLLGICLSDQPLKPYLEFPPVTRYVQHAPFSWWAFISLALIVGAIIGSLALKAWRNGRRSTSKPAALDGGPLPWWGWLGLGGLAAAWLLAWSRFEWMKPVQPHTFTPLWISYIVVVNALSQKRTGKCLMCDRPLFFLLLFPLSALFWWFFEYLNRFVQNWYYIGPPFSPWSYFWFATLPFSTVLPAVLSTGEWLRPSAWIQTGFRSMPPVPALKSRSTAGVAMVAAGTGLMFIGIWPNVLFPLLWLSPLLIVGSLQAWKGEHQIFAEMAAGDWRRAATAAAAALLCGFFWEMWNLYSLARWEYSIPLVHRFQLFEMPILGYAGYLPFGLECLVIGDLLAGLIEPETSAAR